MESTIGELEKEIEKLKEIMVGGYGFEHAKNFIREAIRYCSEDDFEKCLEFVKKARNSVEREKKIASILEELHGKIRDTSLMKIYEEIGDLAGVSTAYNNLAGIYADALGDHQKAVEFAKKDLEISRRTGNKYYEIYALTGLGGEYRELGMKEEAMKCYLEALELARQTGEKRIHSSLLARIGVSFAEEGDFEKAFKYIEESLGLPEETGFWDIKAEVLSAKGEILALAEKYDEAEDYYLQAIQVYREAGAEELATDLYCDLARIYIRIGRNNEAKAILEDAVQFYLRTKFLEPKARKLQEEIKKLEAAGSNS